MRRRFVNAYHIHVTCIATGKRMCCVFQPAFGYPCCGHPNAGQDTFIWPFSSFLMIFDVFRDFSFKNRKKRLTKNTTLLYGGT